jgi:photosynthetic reaction center H subunit
MPTGAITGYIDVAQLVLYAFWIFFAGLVYYLRREDKREGYPLQSDRTNRTSRMQVIGWPAPPEPKTFRLPNGQGTRTSPPPPQPHMDSIPGTKPSAPWPGAPLVPTGNPMLDGVGPASYPAREDVPDLTYKGTPKVVPMRVATDYYVESADPDPRGMDVVAADGKVVGKVSDLWVDRAEHRVLFFEVTLDGADGSTHNPLLPYGFARVKFGKGQILVGSIMAEHFKDVPRTASMDQITRLEEDRITAYYASGHLYATPERQEPLI